MPKSDSLQGSLDLLVLKILSRRPGLHGYAIMTAIQEVSSDVLRAGGIAVSGAAPDGRGRVHSCQVGYEGEWPTGAHLRTHDDWQTTTCD